MEDEGSGCRARRPPRERTKGLDTLHWRNHRDEVEQRDRLVSAGLANQTLGVVCETRPKEPAINVDYRWIKILHTDS